MSRLLCMMLLVLFAGEIFASINHIDQEVESGRISWSTTAENEILKSSDLKKSDVALGILGASNIPVFYYLAADCGGLSSKISFLDNDTARFSCGIGAGAAIALGIGVFAAKLSEKYLPEDMTPDHYNISRTRHNIELAIYLATGLVACTPLFYLNQILLSEADGILSPPGHVIFSLVATLMAGISYVWGLYSVAHDWVLDPLEKFRVRSSSAEAYANMNTQYQRYILKLDQFSQNVKDFSSEELDAWNEYTQDSRFDVERFLAQINNTVQIRNDSSSYSEITIAGLSAVIGILSGYANWPLSVIAFSNFVNYMGGNGQTNVTQTFGNIVGLASFLSLGSINCVSGYASGKSIYKGIIALPDLASGSITRIKNYFASNIPFTKRIEPVINTTLNAAALYFAVSSAMPQMTIALMAVNPGVWNTILQISAAAGGTATAWFSMRRIIYQIYHKLLVDAEVIEKETLISRAQQVTRRLKYLKEENL